MFDAIKMPGVVLAFVLGACTFALGQSTVKIEGYVTSGDGQPLAGANVVVIGTGHGAVSDGRGYFFIENLFAGEYQIEARFMGYEPGEPRTVVVSKDSGVNVNFVLRPRILSLGKIVVEGKRPAQAISVQQILSRETIEQSGAATLDELLSSVAGVQVVGDGTGSGRKRLSIRGSNPNQVLVFYDGVLLNDPFSAEADLSGISLASVEEIRITKGGASHRYGSGALGGVIEVISRKYRVDEVRLSSKAGSFNTLGIQPLVAGSVGKLTYLLNFEHAREKGDFPYAYTRLDGSTVREQRLNADFTANNYFGKFALELNQHTLQIQANIYHSQRGLPGLVFAWTPFAQAETERRILIGKYSMHTDRWRSELQLSQHLNRNQFLNDPPEQAPPRFRAVPAYHSKYRVLSHRAALDNDFFGGESYRSLLQAVIQSDSFEDEDLRGGFLGGERKTQNLNASVMARGEWHLSIPGILTTVLVTHAVRVDYFSFKSGALRRRDSQISPSLGLVLSRQHGVRTMLSINWGRSFRVPSFADLFFQDFRIRGNPDLLPETSWGFDAQVKVGLPVPGRWELSAGYFRQRIDNLVVWQLGSFATWQPSNSKALLRGWELSGTWSFLSGHVVAQASHVILRAINKNGERTTHNRILTYRPAHTTNLGVRVNLAPIVLNYQRRVVAKRFTNASNQKSLPMYAVDDLTLLLKMNFKGVGFNLNASLFNLFDARYEIVRRAPMPGRHWRVGLEIVR
ncbi:MAG: TonB-dependent receptor domain-containing protein [bacterium]